MKLMMQLFFAMIVVYFSYHFIRTIVMIRTVNKQMIFPMTDNERLSLCIYPQKHILKPTFTEQKVGIILYSVIFIYVITMYIFVWYFSAWNESIFLLLLLPFLHSGNILNIFAMTNKGIFRGTRFIKWKNIQSYELIPIDFNHKFYGASKEVNGGYELKINTKTFPASFIVTKDSTKEKIVAIFQERDITEKNIEKTFDR